MPALRHAVLLAALPVSALAGGASSASAATVVSNPGTFTASEAGSLEWDTSRYGPCSSGSLTGSVSSSGAVSVTGAAFNTCVDGLGGSETVSPVLLSPWVAQIKGSAGAYRLDTLPVRLDSTLSTGATCHYNGGSVTTVSAASPLSQLVYSTAGPLTSSTTGCGDMTWTGYLDLSRSLTISGSL